MSRSEYLDDVRKWLQESVDFFSSRDSFLKEKYVATEFLLNLAIEHEEQELQRGEDPPDVIFRDARFEVKEIVDKDCRRLPKYKEALAIALAATDPADLLEKFTPKSMSISQIFDIILARASELANRKYPARVRSCMDLLFYVNLKDVMGLVENPYPTVEPLAALGFRSVSFLDGRRSCIFCADTEAPPFLRTRLGITHRAFPDA